MIFSNRHKVFIKVKFPCYREKQETNSGKLTLIICFAMADQVQLLAGSWLLESVENMFNIARIPKPHCDTISELPSSSSREARSILVMIHNWCYLVVVYRAPPLDHPTSRPTLLSPGEIEAQLRAVVLDVEGRLANGEKPLPVGVLSADDRGRWADVRIFLYPHCVS